jgi:type VI secretion system secreted protein Hcp
MFLKIDDVKGESQDHKHKDEIEVLSFSLGGQQTGTSVIGGGMGAGKVSFQDAHFTKNIDKSSPVLFARMTTGKHIKKAVLTVRKAGGDQQEYLTITFEDILVSSLQHGGSGGEVVPEQVSLNFSKITYLYKPQKADGSLDSGTPIGWDLKQNKPV